MDHYSHLRKVYQQWEGNSNIIEIPAGEPQAVVAEATCFRTYRLNDQISVIYVPTARCRRSILDLALGRSFQVQLECFPVGNQSKECLVIPVGESSLTSLTGRCACIKCLKQSIIEAEREGWETAAKLKELFIPTTLLTTAIQWSQEGPGLDTSV